MAVRDWRREFAVRRHDFGSRPAGRSRSVMPVRLGDPVRCRIREDRVAPALLGSPVSQPLPRPPGPCEVGPTSLSEISGARAPLGRRSLSVGGHDRGAKLPAWAANRTAVAIGAFVGLCSRSTRPSLGATSIRSVGPMTEDHAFIASEGNVISGGEVVLGAWKGLVDALPRLPQRLDRGPGPRRRGHRARPLGRRDGPRSQRTPISTDPRSGPLVFARIASAGGGSARTHSRTGR